MRVTDEFLAGCTTVATSAELPSASALDSKIDAILKLAEAGKPASEIAALTYQGTRPDEMPGGSDMRGHGGEDSPMKRADMRYRRHLEWVTKVLEDNNFAPTC